MEVITFLQQQHVLTGYRVQKLIYLRLFMELFCEDFSSFVRTNQDGSFNNHAIYTCIFWEKREGR